MAVMSDDNTDTVTVVDRLLAAGVDGLWAAWCPTEVVFRLGVREPLVQVFFAVGPGLPTPWAPGGGSGL